MPIQTFLYNLFQSIKGAAANEENIGCINLKHFLMRMLSASLRGHIGCCPFDDLKKRLLYAFTGHISGDGNILRLLGNLVNLINIDDSILCAVNVIICRLNQL